MHAQAHQRREHSHAKRHARHAAQVCVFARGNHRRRRGPEHSQPHRHRQQGNGCHRPLRPRHHDPQDQREIV